MIDMKKPTKADHTFYTDTQDEIQKLEKCQAFIESIKEFLGKETFNISEQNPMSFTKRLWMKSVEGNC